MVMGTAPSLLCLYLEGNPAQQLTGKMCYRIKQLLLFNAFTLFLI